MRKDGREVLGAEEHDDEEEEEARSVRVERVEPGRGAAMPRWPEAWSMARGRGEGGGARWSGSRRRASGWRWPGEAGWLRGRGGLATAGSGSLQGGKRSLRMRRRGAGEVGWEREKERENDKVQGPKKEKQGPVCRWKGLIAKREKRWRVAARRQGVGKKFPGGNPRVWRLGGLVLDWATLSLAQTFIFFFFCKTILANNFRKRRRPSR